MGTCPEKLLIMLKFTPLSRIFREHSGLQELCFTSNHDEPFAVGTPQPRQVGRRKAPASHPDALYRWIGKNKIHPLSLQWAEFQVYSIQSRSLGDSPDTSLVHWISGIVDVSNPRKA